MTYLPHEAVVLPVELPEAQTEPQTEDERVYSAINRMYEAVEVTEERRALAEAIRELKQSPIQRAQSTYRNGQ